MLVGAGRCGCDHDHARLLEQGGEVGGFETCGAELVVRHERIVAEYPRTEGGGRLDGLAGDATTPDEPDRAPEQREASDRAVVLPPPLAGAQIAIRCGDAASCVDHETESVLGDDAGEARGAALPMAMPRRSAIR